MRISFNRIADVFDKTRGLPENVMKQLVKKLTDELHDHRVVLDAGVGTGRLAKPLQDNGFEVFGIDIAEKMMSKAVEKGVNNLLQADACFIPFRNGSFDVTISVGLLHLISEWQTALREICRVTKGMMVSLSYARKNQVREAYRCLLHDYGYSSRRLGKAEWELKDLVKPSKLVFVAAYETDAGKRLDYLDQRASSSQWIIPEDVNKRVVDELRSQFSGKKLSQELHIPLWNIEDLNAYCIETETRQRISE